MLCWIAILGGFCHMMGQHTRSESLFHYFRLKITSRRTICCASSIATSVLILCARSCAIPTATPADRRLVRKYYCAFSCSATCTASPASGSWWKSCACIWRGAGSPAWASSRRSLITRRSPRTGMAAFRSRLLDAEALPRMLAEGPVYAREVPQYCHPHL